MGRFPFIALLILSAMLNWCTTCCCGESMFVEIARGSCGDHGEGLGHHGHAHAGGSHSGNRQHSCYKPFGSTFLPGGPLDVPAGHFAGPAVVVERVSRAAGDWARITAGLARERTPGIFLPDILLITQNLLI